MTTSGGPIQDGGHNLAEINSLKGRWVCALSKHARIQGGWDKNSGLILTP